MTFIELGHLLYQPHIETQHFLNYSRIPKFENFGLVQIWRKHFLQHTFRHPLRKKLMRKVQQGSHNDT